MSFSGSYASAQASAPNSDLTDFIFVVDLADMPANWWSDVDTSDGTKGRASKDDGTTELATDWIEFDNVGQTGFVWVLWTGTASSATPETIRIYPPKSGNTSYAVTDTYGRNAVYANATAAFHYNEDPSGTSPQITDVTGNGNDLTSAGSMTSADVVAGKIGNALDFDGADDELSGGTPPTLTDAFTFLCWVKPDSVSAGFQYAVGMRESSEFLTIGLTNDDLKIGTSGETPGDGNDAFPVDTWLHIGVRHDGNDTELDGIANGVVSYTSTLNGTGWQSSTELVTGNNASGAFWDGLVGESIYFPTNLPNDYISYFYTNQNDITAFWGTWTYTSVGATYTLTAEQGSYSLTGQATGLLRTLRLISEQGSYTYTGQTTNLLKTYLLAAEQGSYTIVGASGELLETFILEAESGNYTLTGQETQFLRTLKLIAGQGTYSLSGQTTNLLRNLLLTAEQGSYSLSGQDAIISAVSNYILTAESGSYSLTGNDTAFLRKLILEAGSGNYTLSGQQTQLLRKLLLSAASGNYTLTGEDIALTVEDSPEILILMSAIVSSLELDSTITTDLDLDSTV